MKYGLRTQLKLKRETLDTFRRRLRRSARREHMRRPGWTSGTAF